MGFDKYRLSHNPNLSRCKIPPPPVTASSQPFPFDTSYLSPQMLLPTVKWEEVSSVTD